MEPNTSEAATGITRVRTYICALFQISVDETEYVRSSHMNNSRENWNFYTVLISLDGTESVRSSCMNNSPKNGLLFRNSRFPFERYLVQRTKTRSISGNPLFPELIEIIRRKQWRVTCAQSTHVSRPLAIRGSAALKECEDSYRFA